MQEILRTVPLPEGIHLFDIDGIVAFATVNWVGTNRKLAYLVSEVDGKMYRQAFEVWPGQEETLLRKAIADFEKNLKEVSLCPVGT